MNLKWVRCNVRLDVLIFGCTMRTVIAKATASSKA